MISTARWSRRRSATQPASIRGRSSARLSWCASSAPPAACRWSATRCTTWCGGTMATTPDSVGVEAGRGGAGQAAGQPAAPRAGELADGAPPGSVRVGRIEFVNCFPLYHHFERELAARGEAATIVEGYPSVLNEMLVSGAIDVALPSSIAVSYTHLTLPTK